MSIAVEFFNFRKKKNSTERPVIGEGTTFNCVLKDGCSIMDPVLELQTSSPVTYNYAYISGFDSRYYFVSEWISDHDRWIARLTEDVLATWRTTIMNSTQFVIRSDSSANTYIIDNMYPITNDLTTQTQLVSKASGSIAPMIESSDIVYVMVLSNNSGEAKINGSQYLCLTQGQLNDFMAACLNGSATYWDNQSQSIGDDILRAIVNPLQYIGAAFCLPCNNLSSSSFATDLSAIKLGFWTVYTPPSGSHWRCAKSIDTAAFHVTRNMTLQRHPQSPLGSLGSEGHGVYLNGAPFSQIYLYAGPFGRIPIDTGITCKSLAASSSPTLKIDVWIDINGKGILTIEDNYTHMIVAKAYADIAVPISLTQVTNNILNWGSNYVGAIGSAVSGNYTGTAAQAGNLVSSIDNIFPKPQTVGVNGSVALMLEYWYLQYEFHHIADGDNATSLFGKPLCKKMTLSSLSGYCQTSEPVLDLNGYDGEYDRISSLMQSGFFLE